MKLSLQQANRIIEVALKRSLDASYKPMAVVVLDDSGQLVSLQRHDGATVFRIDIAMGKAWASVNMGVSS